METGSGASYVASGSCLVDEHDLQLVVLAAVVGIPLNALTVIAPFSRAVRIFLDRSVPEAAVPVGYAALIAATRIEAIYADTQRAAG